MLRSVSSSELSAHEMPRAGPAAHSRPSDERTTFVDARDHAWVRMDTVYGSCWKNLDTQHSQCIRPGRGSCGGAPDSVHRRRGVGAVPVLGQVLGGSVVVQRQLRCSLGCSTLTSVDVLV